MENEVKYIVYYKSSDGFGRADVTGKAITELKDLEIIEEKLAKKLNVKWVEIHNFVKL